MKQTVFYFTTILFLFGINFLLYTENAYTQDLNPRSFFIEIQPDSPLLIRDLSAVILPESPSRLQPMIEVTYYLENRSEKKIKRYSLQNPAEDDRNYEDYQESAFGGNLLPGESRRSKFTTSYQGDSLVLRVKEVDFEDGTHWKAEPFDATKPNKSSRIFASVQSDEKSNDLKPKRTIAREGWQKPIIADRVTKVIKGEPKVIDGINVETKLHLLNREILKEIESCDIEGDKLRKSLNSFNYEVQKFTSYEIQGKVFAYTIGYWLIDPKSGDDMGAGSTFVYVDENGNGVFKLRCDVFELKSLPDWVKQL